MKKKKYDSRPKQIHQPDIASLFLQGIRLRPKLHIFHCATLKDSARKGISPFLVSLAILLLHQ
jgi:hypothetical protein